MNVFVMLYREAGVNTFCGVFASRNDAAVAGEELASHPSYLHYGDRIHITECKLGELITDFMGYL